VLQNQGKRQAKMKWWGANRGVSNRRFPGESRKWDIREQFSGLFVIYFFFLATVFPELLPAVARGFCIEEDR
jgi:hypothetical protein